jgi:hypothetical protein
MTGVVSISALFLFSGPALALQVPTDGVPKGPVHFFSFERAKGYWTELTTREALDLVAAKCDASAYAEWIKAFRKNRSSALDALKNHPEIETIKGCYDLQMTFNVFNKVYATKYMDPAAPWNESSEEGDYCQWASHYNVFAESCNDLPDWRTQELRDRDQQHLDAAQSR